MAEAGKHLCGSSCPSRVRQNRQDSVQLGFEYLHRDTLLHNIGLILEETIQAGKEDEQKYPDRKIIFNSAVSSLQYSNKITCLLNFS